MTRVKPVRPSHSLVGLTIPKYLTTDSDIAIWIEDKIKKDTPGYNTGAGPDIQLTKNIGVEYKTRRSSAKSAHTIGSMTLNDIKSTPYEESNIYKKFQYHRRIKHSNRVVVEDEIYDFTYNSIQQKIKESYESARQKIINGNNSYYIPGGAGKGRGKQFGYFENTQKDDANSRCFRIPHSAMIDLEQESKNLKNKMFNYGDTSID